MWGIRVGLTLVLSLCSSAVRRVLQSFCKIVMMPKCLIGVPLMLNFRRDCEGFLPRFVARSFPQPKWLVPVSCGPRPFWEARNYGDVWLLSSWAFEDWQWLLTAQLQAAGCPRHPSWGTAAAPGNLGNPSLGRLLVCDGLGWAAQCSWSCCQDGAQLCWNSASTLASLRDSCKHQRTPKTQTTEFHTHPHLLPKPLFIVNQGIFLNSGV